MEKLPVYAIEKIMGGRKDQNVSAEKTSKAVVCQIIQSIL